MKYDFEIIGKRIKKEYKAAGYTLDTMMDEIKSRGIPVGRNTLSALVTGKANHFDCDLLFALCDMFDCEMGYLLGEYECKTGRETDICSETGLTEDAVHTLQQMRDDNDTNAYSDILSTILESDPASLDQTMQLLSMAITAHSKQNRAANTQRITINLGNMAQMVASEDIIDSALGSRIARTLDDITDRYMKRYGETPLARHANATIRKFIDDAGSSDNAVYELNDMSDEEYENLRGNLTDDEFANVVMKHLNDD